MECTRPLSLKGAFVSHRGAIDGTNYVNWPGFTSKISFGALTSEKTIYFCKPQLPRPTTLR